MAIVDAGDVEAGSSVDSFALDELAEHAVRFRLGESAGKLCNEIQIHFVFMPHSVKYALARQESGNRRWLSEDREGTPRRPDTPRCDRASGGRYAVPLCRPDNPRYSKTARGTPPGACRFVEFLLGQLCAFRLAGCGLGYAAHLLADAEPCAMEANAHRAWLQIEHLPNLLDGQLLHVMEYQNDAHDEGMRRTARCNRRCCSAWSRLPSGPTAASCNRQPSSASPGSSSSKESMYWGASSVLRRMRQQRFRMTV